MAKANPKSKKDILPKSNRSTIVTFVQLPPSPDPYKKLEKKKSAAPDGTELFSLFTADIIKEDVLFTR